METVVISMGVAVLTAVIAGVLGIRVGGLASRAADRERARVASELANGVSLRVGEMSHGIAEEVQAAVAKEVAKAYRARQQADDKVAAAVQKLETELSRVVRPRLPVPSALADDVVPPPKKFMEENPLVEVTQLRRIRRDPELEKTRVYQPGQLNEALRSEPCAT